ncbi:sensor histidine kinase [Streptomyces endophyticus]|uniref:histidine kinase n=1 Tax=Streptomyces endophyticus TaxID=714166 RepID=A0ABU6F951_9ACTN|nr:HAMP domain-containing sensor histidine kinase [Streptomyces endophyticus]MEB8339327.1 HAMP domain-containing histidine kinase [Streptomyces endophyticus]
MRPLPRFGPRTLRGRLSLVALTSATLLITVLTVAFNAVAQQHLQHQADDELTTRAAAVATTVDTSGPAVRVHEGAHDDLLDSNVWIYDGSRLIERPPNATPDSPVGRRVRALVTEGGRPCVDAGDPREVRLCAFPLRGRTGGAARTGGATIVTALDLTPYRTSADTLLYGSLALDAVMLACTYALTRLAVGCALRPVRAMTDQATQWGAVAAGERFGSPPRLPAELARLGWSLDALLDRIRALLRHERQLTAELSHELRTPLSRIIAELDWWQARPRTPADTRATHLAISDAATCMHTICDTLLRDAREEASAAPGTAEALPALRRTAQRLHPPGHLTLTVTSQEPRLQAGVDAALLERIVSPLLANALRHAHAQVSVHARSEGDGVRIDVSDDGPGVPPPFAGQLFVPGRRADPGDGHGGAGLGLPLARRLARSVGGEVHFDEQHTPGARFTVRLPPA